MGGISQDMKKQDNKLVESIEESIVGNQCLMTTTSTNKHVEECPRHQANHIVSYFQVTGIKGTTTARGCTHQVWMKSMVKDYVVLEEVLTPHYENLGGMMSTFCNHFIPTSWLVLYCF